MRLHIRLVFGLPGSLCLLIKQMGRGRPVKGYGFALGNRRGSKKSASANLNLAKITLLRAPVIQTRVLVWNRMQLLK